MGNKIITEKDFWMCSCGAVPAQFQSTQTTVKKKSNEKYITVRDTATSSWIDFGCTRLMLVYAIIAAAVVVIAAMTVATGGAALIALGALAGLAGAAWGAVVGSMLCGQLAAKARKWVGSKKNYIVQGVETITGGHTMTCPVGGVVTFAPQIKSWSQAISLGAANYIGGLMEGMMAGAAIGMGGAALSGGAGAFATGGMRGLGQAALQFAKSAPMNVIRNIGASFGYAGAGASASTAYTTAAAAIGLRGLTATQAGLQHYGSTGESGWTEAGKGVFGIEKGLYNSANNLTTFHNPKTGELQWQGTWQDVAGLALMLSPVHKAAEEPKAKVEEPVKDGEPAKDSETVKDVNIQKEETVKQDGEFEAFEDPPKVEEPIVVAKRTNQALIDTLTKMAEEMIRKAKEKIDGFSKTKNGPCLSGVYDTVTGKTYYGQNFLKNVAGNKEYANFVENAHPLIKEEIAKQQKAIDAGKMPENTDRRAGAHSEVRALDEAIKAREAETGKPVTKEDLGSFDLHNRHLPSNTPFDRCVNCQSITNGTNNVGGHK